MSIVQILNHQLNTHANLFMSLNIFAFTKVSVYQKIITTRHLDIRMGPPPRDT